MSQALFDDVHEVEARILHAPHILLCLDFDGTLAHFTATSLARFVCRLRWSGRSCSLAEIADVTLAIISGRERADLQARIGMPGLIYAGNHGLEISGPGFIFVEPTAAAQVGTLQELADELTAKLQAIPGALVEDKGLTISVHYPAGARRASGRGSPHGARRPGHHRRIPLC